MGGSEKLFLNRRNAGVELGQTLKGRYGNENILVLAIPKGGVEVSYEIARTLNTEPSTIIAKNLLNSSNSDVAIGALSEDEEIFLTPLGKNLNESTMQENIKNQTNKMLLENYMKQHA